MTPDEMDGAAKQKREDAMRLNAEADELTIAAFKQRHGVDINSRVKGRDRTYSITKIDCYYGRARMFGLWVLKDGSLGKERHEIWTDWTKV